MSGVDVLAVMDDAQCDAEHAWGCRSEKAADLREARAAVAELIEAAAAVEALATLHDGDDRMFDRLHAALARVQGGQS